MAKSHNYDYKADTLENRVRGDMYGMETMKWYGWGSPVGLGIGLGLIMGGVGLMLWLMHLANIIH